MAGRQPEKAPEPCRFWPWPPGRPHQEAPGAGRLGLSLFLVSIGALFGAIVVAYLVMRARHAWALPPGVSGLPRLLWVSTALLFLASAFLYAALRAVRRDAGRRTYYYLLAATLLGTGFLGCQALVWLDLLGKIPPAARQHVFFFLFYLLTVAHALHVLGGLIPMAFVTWNAWKDRYWSLHHPGVLYCNMYWHFLLAVWLVFFGLLVATV